jgi:hypothetical protein
VEQTRGIVIYSEVVRAIQKGGKKKERIQGVDKLKKKKPRKQENRKVMEQSNRETKKEVKEKQKTDKLIKA